MNKEFVLKVPPGKKSEKMLNKIIFGLLLISYLVAVEGKFKNLLGTSFDKESYKLI